MIYMQMGGRLGNQFFKYAAARALQRRFYPDEPLCFDFGYLADEGTPEDGWVNGLLDFNVCPYEIHKKKGVLLREGSLRQKIVSARYYLGLRKFDRFQMTSEYEYEKRWHDRLTKAGVYWYRTGYLELGKSDAKDKLMSGTFESPEYFEDQRELLLQEFTPKMPPMPQNAELYDVAHSPESVCLSVRRGDFESNSTFRALHSVCDKSYFLRAIDEMKRRLDRPVFILFSDEIDWVKENIRIEGAESYYESGSDPVWEKVRLMSNCSNFIVSNSSFSWWTQWLSTNKDKIVISPSRWFNNDFNWPLITDDMVTIQL